MQRFTVTGEGPVSMTCSLQWTTQWRSLVWLTRAGCAWAAGATCVTLTLCPVTCMARRVSGYVSAGRHPDKPRYH